VLKIKTEFSFREFMGTYFSRQANGGFSERHDTIPAAEMKPPRLEISCLPLIEITIYKQKW